MVYRVLHARLNEFLRVVTKGKLINRFSNDIDVIDKDLPDTANQVNFLLPKSVLNVLSIVAGVQNGLSVAPVLFMAFLGLILRDFYMRVRREAIRLFLVTRSPIIGLGVSLVSGGPVIRSFAGFFDFFEKKISLLIDENSKNQLLSAALEAWFSTYMAILDFFVVKLPCYAILVYTLYGINLADDDAYNRLTVFMLAILEFSVELTTLYGSISTAETVFLSVERCMSFERVSSESGYQSFHQEAAVFSEPLKNAKIARKMVYGNKGENRRDLFKNGVIQMVGVSARYPTRSKNVLTAINLKIGAGEKIGIVGKSGAGKSSLMKLLWRGLSYKGSILIDNQKIDEIDLKILRSQITVISQKSTLFEGTLASNVSQSTETLSKRDLGEIEALLRKLKFPEKKLEIEGLGFHIEADGANLSEGERQIVGFVRGVFNRRKIVLLDEISSFVDPELEGLFKEVSREAFGGCTLLVIAHRLETVVDCDKIVFLENGRLVEFGAPGELLADAGSRFYALCNRR